MLRVRVVDGPRNVLVVVGDAAARAERLRQRRPRALHERGDHAHERDVVLLVVRVREDVGVGPLQSEAQARVARAGQQFHKARGRLLRQPFARPALVDVRMKRQVFGRRRVGRFAQKFERRVEAELVSYVELGRGHGAADAPPYACPRRAVVVLVVLVRLASRAALET